MVRNQRVSLFKSPNRLTVAGVVEKMNPAASSTSSDSHAGRGRRLHGQAPTQDRPTIAAARFSLAPRDYRKVTAGASSVQLRITGWGQIKGK